jgi:hypothetical protein
MHIKIIAMMIIMRGFIPQAYQRKHELRAAGICEIKRLIQQHKESKRGLVCKQRL